MVVAALAVLLAVPAALRAQGASAAAPVFTDAAGTFGFLGASRNWPIYLVVSLVTASFSLVIGLVFLTGHATVLPAFFGG